MEIELNNEGPVSRLHLRPIDGRSVFTFAALQAMHSAIEGFQQDPHSRVLLIEGGDGLFCTGMDLDAVTGGDSNTEAGIMLYREIVTRLRQGPQVVLCLVDGEVAAGGVGLVACSDVVIATERSSFALPEVMLGFLPAMVLPLLMERMPPQRVRRLALGVSALGLSTTEAHQAHADGLVDLLVVDRQAQDKALRKVLKHLLRLCPNAAGRVKSFCRELATMEVIAGIAQGAELTLAAMASPSTVKTIEAFFEGEPPPWFDRYRPQKKRGDAQ